LATVWEYKLVAVSAHDLVQQLEDLMVGVLVVQWVMELVEGLVVVSVHMLEEEMALLLELELELE
jgi:hypothetical protein